MKFYYFEVRCRFIMANDSKNRHQYLIICRFKFIPALLIRQMLKENFKDYNQDIKCQGGRISF